MPDLSRLARAAAALAEHLPFDVAQAVCAAAEASVTLRAALDEIGSALPQANLLGHAEAFLKDCAAADVDDPRHAAIALLAAAEAVRIERARQTVEVVWTGPAADALPFRRTEQALLEIIDGATGRLTLVSFAVYAIPRVRDAIVRAAARGVRIAVIVETPDRLGGTHEYDTLRALGPKVQACAAVYYWPTERRPAIPGRTALLHAKCAIADGRQLFASSANLTDHAFTSNLELGVLVTGGRAPELVEARFAALIRHGVLVRA